VRVPLDPSELVVGVECGGSDAWSGITANPSVGATSDLVVAAGGTVILSEVTELIGAEALLAARAANEDVARSILRVVRAREEAVRKGRIGGRGDRPASPEDLAPGNVAGGLTTIEEKSLGAIAKGGTSPVREVLAYGRPTTEKGVVIMDTAGNDPESVTGMVAGGAQIVLFTTGRGSPTGCPIAPTIKIASNTPTFDALRDDMDVDAGTLLDGETLEEVGSRIAEEMAAVACGRLTAAERGGHGVFAIERLGPKT
jgi:altronate dehydratase large subunit